MGVDDVEELNITTQAVGRDIGHGSFPCYSSVSLWEDPPYYSIATTPQQWNTFKTESGSWR